MSQERLAAGGPDLILEDTRNGRGLFAARVFAKGEALTAFAERFVDMPTKYTIQIDACRHLDTAGNPGAFANHSCAPNSRFAADSLQIIALELIQPGAEITLNYLSFEWDLSSPFACSCGAERCFGFIRGFRYLGAADRQRLQATALPYLLTCSESGFVA